MQSASAREGVDGADGSASEGVVDTHDGARDIDGEGLREPAAGSAGDGHPGYPTQDQDIEEALDPRGAATAEEGAAFAGGGPGTGRHAAGHGEQLHGDGAHRVDGDGGGGHRSSSDQQAASDRDALLDFLAGHQGGSAASMDKVAELREERNELKTKTKRVTKDMKNEARKRSRRMANSAKLSTMDLVAVLEDRKLKAEAKAAAKSKAKAKAKAR